MPAPKSTEVERTMHTPAPWTVQAAIDETGAHVFASAQHGAAGGLVTVADLILSDADARLIAAAPELLEACRNVAGWVSEYDERLTEAQRKAIQITKDAIAKAEGRA
jgi:hypothetical protein